MTETLTPRQRKWLAIVLILIVDVLWVSSSELTQSIFENESFEHPFFLSYLNTSCFSLYGLLFIPLFWRTLRRKHASLANETVADYESINAQPTQSQARSRCCVSSLPADHLGIWATLKLSAWFCLVWFAMTFAFNLSLSQTSVASNPPTRIQNRGHRSDSKRP